MHQFEYWHHVLTLTSHFDYNQFMLSFYLNGLKKIFNLVKKVLLVVIVFFTVISLFVYFIKKDKPQLTYDPVKKNREEIYKFVNDPKLKSTKEGRVTIAFYRLMACTFIGEACSNNPQEGDKNFNNSLFGFMGNLIVLPYSNPPASGIYWAYSGLQNAGFISESYAAEGVGFGAIKPFIKIWSVFRNLAFILIVLILISIGFMIMFRMKINPQTVISVENSLPKIAIALLLITFSYAIAGFLIDIMYIVILKIISTLSTINFDQYTPANAFNLINEYVGAGSSKLFPVKYNLINTGNYLLSILPLSLGRTLKFIGGYLAAFGIAHWIGNKFDINRAFKGFSDIGFQAATFGLQIGDLPDFIGLLFYWVLTFTVLMPLALPLVIGILVGLTILFLFFRIFFLLLTNYIQILLLILFAPVILLFEAIPGRNTFAWWFKNLLANLLVFPLVILIILTSDIIIKINAQVGTNQFWAPPFLYPLNQEAITILIGIGIYLLIPDLVKMVKELLGVKGVPVSFGLGTFFSGVSTPVGGAMGFAGGFGSISLAVPGIRRFGQRILGGKLGSLLDPNEPKATPSPG